MIRGYQSENGCLNPISDMTILSQSMIWIDLASPTRGEEKLVEDLVGINVPTKEDMEEIEISSRLYLENGAAFMTVILPSRTETGDPEMHPVTFVLTDRHLITIRYHEPRSFRTFPARAEKIPVGCETAEEVLMGLLEATVDRLADILERDGQDIDGISRRIFRHRADKPTRTRDFQEVLENIGQKGDLTSKIRDSLVSFDRMAGFLSHLAQQRRSGKNIRERIKTLSRDIRSLADYAGFLSQQITFLLDATLGMINIEQNAIIKIFSVAAVVFLPPTLIASIYGMNFTHMPELDWPFGYPFAIGLMIVSAILPYVYFKRRGWL